MGQAKNRGSLEQRMAEAKARKAMERAKFPDTVDCNNCKAPLADIEPMDVRGIPGMRLAGSAYCEDCQSSTWVLDGTQGGLAAVTAMLTEGRNDVSFGVARRPQ